MDRVLILYEECPSCCTVAPNLKHLKLHCCEIQRVEIICAASLETFSYMGVKGVEYFLKSVPNLTGLCLGGCFALLSS
ncbi:unnamed protein product [Cuscuta campestris]|uniref:FBD domain-containing protein n=1 Tax=Cuscuta campestris TaxID=132261 RepID=A0A484MUE0_9ASTE|nr:unnamed protein product [Cuscuta campestris]VFQ92453.1 unnamed protein product [Cuscuta campestris]